MTEHRWSGYPEPGSNRHNPYVQAAAAGAGEEGSGLGASNNEH